MDSTKPWFKSETIWSGVVIALRGLYLLAQVVSPYFGHVVPNIPPLLDGILSSVLGANVVKGRWIADTQIG